MKTTLRSLLIINILAFWIGVFIEIFESENFSQSSNTKNNSNSNIDQSKISKINNSDTKEEKPVVTEEN